MHDRGDNGRIKVTDVIGRKDEWARARTLLLMKDTDACGRAQEAFCCNSGRMVSDEMGGGAHGRANPVLGRANQIFASTEIELSGGEHRNRIDAANPFWNPEIRHTALAQFDAQFLEIDVDRA